MTFLLLISSVLVLCIILIKWTQTYWLRQGVTEIKPKFFTGNVIEIVLYRKSWGQLIHGFYKELKNKGVRYGGMYFFLKPAFIPLDPQLIKNIMIDNSRCFDNRGIYFNEEYEPVSANVVSMEGKSWKDLRTRMLPTFAPNELKNMFESFRPNIEGFRNLLKNRWKNKEAVDVQDLTSSFATDILVSSLFGIESECIENIDNEYHQHGKKIAHLTWQKSMTLIVAQLFPRKLCGILGMRFTDKKVQNFFMDIAKEVIAFRDENKIVRKDLVQAMMDVRHRDNLSNDKLYIRRLNDTAAQCFVAFIAGYETTATVLKFALVELASNTEVQNILRKEIEKHDNFSYETVSQMEYLEQVVLETLRKYPVCPVLLRSCNYTYKVPNTNITLKKGSLINIPVLALHMDPEYHPDPEKFKPERFNKENKPNIKEFTYLPFGLGPRGCLGYKFGKLIVKAGIIEIVRNYTIKLHGDVAMPIEMSPNSFFVTTKNNIYLTLERISEK